MKRIILGFLMLAFFVVITDAFAKHKKEYPDEIRNLVDRVPVVYCEKNFPRKVRVDAYAGKKENWVVRVFAKDDDELEIWLNYGRSIFWEYYPDKIFYFSSPLWVDAADISAEEAARLDRRLKFTEEELSFFKKCFKDKLK